MTDDLPPLRVVGKALIVDVCPACRGKHHFRKSDITMAPLNLLTSCTNWEQLPFGLHCPKKGTLFGVMGRPSKMFLDLPDEAVTQI